MSDFDYINVWGSELLASLKEEIVSFWIDNNAMSEGDARQRISQVGFVAKHRETDKVAAVLSVFETLSPRIKKNFYAYRIFVGEQFRKQHLAGRVLNLANAFFEQQFLLGKTENVGLLIVSENKQFNAYRNEAVWPATGFTFIGYTPDGSQIRLKYFREARI